MKLTNQEIYQIASQIEELSNMNIYIPAKANFFMQKNINLIKNAAAEIEKTRLNIAQQYGTLDEEKNGYYIPPEHIEIANKEILDLFAIEQELDVKTFSIDDLGKVELTPFQMQVLMFMIKE